MADFKRYLNDRVQKNLKDEPLFLERLLPDILKGEVFPAIRNDYVDFYCAGRRLFRYDINRFKTHIKYASVLKPKNIKNPYIHENELATYKPIENFSSGYEQIKDNCENYSGTEGYGVSYLYKYSYAIEKHPTVVLDIEIAFSGDEEAEKKIDRIDILLLNKKENSLRFIEAKHYSNKEIGGTSPKVVDQICGYSKILNKNTRSILEQYKHYIAIVNELFSLQLPEGVKLADPQVALYAFGFDNDQNNGGVKTLKDKMKKAEIKLYPLGGHKKIDAKTLWDKTC